MVGYNSDENALTLGDDDSLKVGDYEVEYSTDSDEFQARYGRPIGGEAGAHGEVQNGVSYTNQSTVGEYAVESNYDGFIWTPYKHDGTDVTIGGFAYVNNTNNRTGFFGHHDQEKRRMYIQSDDEFDTFQYGFGNSFFTTSTTIPTNEWFHIALTFSTSDNTARFYLNGVEESTGDADWVGDKSTSRLAILASAGDDTASWLMDGREDDIRIYDRQLSSAEITDWSNNNPPTSGLLHNWDFEYPETPDVAIDSTGDVYPKNSIPRATSGSLVPQGLAESVSAGEALADDGNSYASVQSAVDAASGWVFVGPGTFTENVTISTAGLTLEGCGEDTLIDGGGIDNAISASVDNVTIANLSVQTTGGDYDAVDLTNSSNSKVRKVHVRQADYTGIDTGPGTQIVSCVIESTFASFISRNDNMVLRNCIMRSTSVSSGIGGGGDNEIIANNIIEDTDGAGIGTSNNDGIIVGNRIINSGEEGIILSSTNDYIVANNRISGSTNSDINDGGAGTVLDDNLTGPSN